MTAVMIAVGFANGEHCPHAGQFLVRFDHEAFGGQGYGVFSLDPDHAMRFPSRADAMVFWGRQSTTKPLRPDGRPNKPLTALTVLIEELIEQDTSDTTN